MINENIFRGNVNWSRCANLADRQMLCSFGSLNPSLARLPHCIMENEPPALTWCMEAIGAKGGIWGQRAIYGWDGEPFLEDDFSSELFKLWEFPANQETVEAMKNGHLEFPLVLDTNAPPSTISLIDNHPIEDCYSYLEHLSIWIESLGWAYVPLEYENDFALFVTAKGKSVLRDRVEEKLRSAGRTVFRLTPENGRFHWRGPIQFEG